MPEQRPKPDPSVYFAAERTLLAWIRTGLAMMGFGFVVARFGLFLRELQAVQPGAAPIQATHMSQTFGTVLVLMGVVVNVAAALNHIRVIRELRDGTWLAGQPSRLGIAAAAGLACMGLAVAVYLLVIQPARP